MSKNQKFRETPSKDLLGDVIQKAIQMEHDLLSRGIPENEVHRAVVQYFSQAEPPYATPWPGPVTGMDLAGNINYNLVIDSGEPTTYFQGLPNDVQPYPTQNISPYGIGSTSQPYPSFFTPAPNSVNSTSNSFDVKNSPNPYESAVWDGLAARKNSEPSMHGEHGFTVAKAIPEWRYNIEQSQMYPLKIPDITIPPSGAVMEVKKDNTKNKLLSMMGKWALLLGGAAGMDAIIKKYQDSTMEQPLEVIAQYTYHGHDSDDECEKFSNKKFNLLETHNRPVIPSEKLGYTTTHPNCICSWKIMQELNLPVDKVTKNEQEEIKNIENHITKAAKKGKLHKVEKDGTLSKNTTKKNPLKELCSCMNVTLPLSMDLSPKFRTNYILPKKSLQEAISNLRSEFAWLDDDYIEGAKKLVDDASGVLYLVRAAGETITDHRSEGEPYRRKLSADELNSMTRTAIGKSMDINHQPELEVEATILDAEFDKNRKEIQMIIIVKDPQINDAIDDGKITAVSINGGMPRSERIEKCENNCTDGNCELCVVPKGVVLGELDGIGMTFVVTDPRGLYWNGRFVPSAEPGIKTTKIEQV